MRPLNTLVMALLAQHLQPLDEELPFLTEDEDEARRRRRRLAPPPLPAMDQNGCTRINCRCHEVNRYEAKEVPRTLTETEQKVRARQEKRAYKKALRKEEKKRRKENKK